MWKKLVNGKLWRKLLSGKLWENSYGNLKKNILFRTDNVNLWIDEKIEEAQPQFIVLRLLAEYYIVAILPEQFFIDSNHKQENIVVSKIPNCL